MFLKLSNREFGGVVRLIYTVREFEPLLYFVIYKLLWTVTNADFLVSLVGPFRHYLAYSLAITGCDPAPLTRACHAETAGVHCILLLVSAHRAQP